MRKYRPCLSIYPNRTRPGDGKNKTTQARRLCHSGMMTISIKGFKHPEHAGISQCGKQHTCNHKTRKKERKYTKRFFHQPSAIGAGTADMVGLFHVTASRNNTASDSLPPRSGDGEKARSWNNWYCRQIHNRNIWCNSKNGADHFNHKTLHEVFPVQGIIAVTVPDHQHDHI